MDKEDKDKKLQAQIGNLEVQISEYRQIIAELTDKLERYEDKHGSVFVKSEKRDWRYSLGNYLT